MRVLYDAQATTCTKPSADQIAERIAAGKLGFWLDIQGPDDDDFKLLADSFHFHELTIEDVRNRNQRPKFDEYPDYGFMVLFAAEWKNGDLAFREHHLYTSASVLVTVHDGPEPLLEDLIKRLEQPGAIGKGRVDYVTYLVVDAIVDGTFPAIDAIDDDADQLQDTALVRARPETLSRITSMRHDVALLRRLLGAERDLFQRLLTSQLHGDQKGDMNLYWRDVYDHLVRQYEQVDGIRDLLSGAMDVYLSTVSNRLNETMKALTAIASLFLPLTFLTGFFGQNFAWLVTRIGSLQAFAAGVTVMIASVALQLFLFHRRGWL